MASVIHRTDVEQWLEDNGGQKGEAIIETEMVDNPRYVEGSEATNGPKKIAKKKVTWYTNNGKKLSVYDDSQNTSDMDSRGYRPDDRDGPAGRGGRDPAYQIEYQGNVPKDDKHYPNASSREDTRNPQDRRKDEEYDREATWNQIHGPNGDTSHPAYNPEHAGRGSGRYESHRERDERERREEVARQQDEDRDRRTRAEEKANELKEEELRIRREAENRASATSERQATNESSRIAIEAERLAVERSRANRPTVIGSPTYKDKTIQQQGPDGTITTTENPLYDELRVRAEDKREELRDAIAHNQMTAAVAAQKYKEWYDKEVAVPLALAKERREQAAERRSAQQAADEERRFAAKYEVDRANVGQAAAESAQANERALLPYRVGPKFGGQFSSAVNGLSGKMDQNSEAGINFTADAFEFKRPDFSGIARKATADALKHLTPYQPTDVSKYATADYSGITLPTSAPTGAPAPESPSYIDTSTYLPPQG